VHHYNSTQYCKTETVFSIFYIVLRLLLFNFVMHCIISTVVVAFEINYLILSKGINILTTLLWDWYLKMWQQPLKYICHSLDHNTCHNLNTTLHLCRLGHYRQLIKTSIIHKTRHIICSILKSC